MRALAIVAGIGALFVAGCGTVGGPEGEEETMDNFFPEKPRYISPVDDSLGVGESVTLQWSGGDPDADDEVRYTIYLDKVSPPEKEVGKVTNTTSYKVENLELEQRYYWKVVATDGKATIASDVWSFATWYKNWSILSTGNSNLPDNTIRLIYTDPDGWLWLGTSSGGIARRATDADSFTVFNSTNSILGSNEIVGLTETADGKKWIGTPQTGAYEVDNQLEGTMYDTLIYAKVGIYLQQAYISNKGIEKMLTDKEGKLWIGTKQGLLRRVDAKWDTFTVNNYVPLPNQKVLAMALDTSDASDSFGRLWIGTTDGVFSCNEIDTALYRRWVFDTVVTARSITAQKVRFSVDESSGDTTIVDTVDFTRSESDTVVKADTTEHDKEHEETFPDTNWVEEETVSSVEGSSVVRDTQYTYSGDTMTVVHIDTTTDTVKVLEMKSQLVLPVDTVSADDGLPAGAVTSLMAQRDGTVWAATLSEGVVRGSGENWEVFSVYNSDLPNNRVSALAEDADGNVWIGTGAGLVRVKDGTWTVYHLDNSGLPSVRITSLGFDADGELLIGTDGGLAVFDRK